MTVAKSVLHTIQERVGSFSKGQRSIANYILENYDKAAFMTANKLGKTVHVSESTVVRFAAELGYDGYPSMQKALQEIIRGKLTSVQRIQASNDRMEGSDILGNVMQRDMESIRNTIESIDRSEFERVVSKLLHAKHIYLLGVRSSSFLAGYLNFYLHFIFENVMLIQSSAAGEIYEQLIRIAPGDVLVGISFPRYSKMAINAVTFARDQGADVVAITDSSVSPLCRLADASLFVPSTMISFVDSMTAPLSLFNALIIAVGRQMNKDVSTTFAQLENIWSQYNVFGKTDDE
jgi:DNA-binding MurR/RpiR family transcriptional regulator